MTIQQINCKNCIAGKHSQCVDENCLCKNDNHGVRPPNLKDGVRVGVSQFSSNELHEFDIAMNDRIRLDDLLDNGRRENSEEYATIELIKLLITAGHQVSIIEIKRIVTKWCNKFQYLITGIDEYIGSVLADKDTFLFMKQICFQLGTHKKEILFDKSQHTEIAYWLMGRYHIKRVELTGDLLFFNDRIYETNAEALIRRNARECMVKSKNNDVVEILKIIQDSCKIITWRDIENSIHLKVLLNGVYDLREGGFSETFSPDNIILNEIPHDYNPSSGWSDIDDVVSDIIENPNDRQSFYDALSNSLFPYTGIDFQFGGVGQPGTGKSQLVKLAEMVLGQKNVGGATIHNIAEDPTTQKGMAYKMLNIDQDMGSETIRHIETLKKWITQDTFTARGIYEQPTTFRPMSRLMFMANELYEIPNSDDAEAMYERTHLIKVNKKHRATQDVVLNIMEKKATPEQLSGFISYLLKNSHEIYMNQKIHHPMSISTVQDTWNLFGNRIKEFINKWIVISPEQVCEHNDPWDKWLSYALSKNYQAKDKKKFKAIFDELMGTSATKSRSDGEQGYYYHGFRLKTDKEIIDEEQTPLDPRKNEEQMKKVIMRLLSTMISGNNEKL